MEWSQLSNTTEVGQEAHCKVGMRKKTVT